MIGPYIFHIVFGLNILIRIKNELDLNQLNFDTTQHWLTRHQHDLVTCFATSTWYKLNNYIVHLMNYRNQGPAVLHPRFLINFGASFCVIYGFTILDRKKGSGLWAYPKLQKTSSRHWKYTRVWFSMNIFECHVAWWEPLNWGSRLILGNGTTDRCW